MMQHILTTAEKLWFILYGSQYHAQGLFGPLVRELCVLHCVWGLSKLRAPFFDHSFCGQSRVPTQTDGWTDFDTEEQTVYKR